ncbi:ELKS/Rab6-interacting/CAST family member 1 [Trachymyrmex zeteki]|uniref:ELKS/Rab6-interacting/CAST family member 1 n=2 Tax=Mycetomoellerius zeteki TaxID=64791 RepID=A0A151WXG0_9HYME|nr:ELKS/Rab6-interacting/CAST family member 1 [Trachymyrmex zeteki]
MENLQMEHNKCKDLLGDAKHIESWKEETETMNQHIVQLEQQLKCCEGLKDINGHDEISNKDIETQPKACENCNPNAKDRHILALERQVTALKNFLKNHTSTTKSSEKDNSDEKTNVKVEESWKQEIEAKNQHIIELKQKVVLLENLLRKNVDAQKMHDLEKRINRKSKRIVELEDAVGELEDYLKEDVKEMRDLRYQISLDKQCIMKMEKWIQKNNLMNAGIDKARIIELEKMVTNLEDYVKEHDIDGLKRKLQDRECRIVQLENQISELRKLSKFEENKPVRDTPKVNFLSNNEVACELEEKKQKIKDVMHAVLEEVNKIQEYEQEESLKIKLQGKEQKMKEMGHDISEKDNRIQRYEQQIVEQQNKILKMEKEMAEMEEGFYETEIINVLKKEIRLKNERVQELEMEVNSLETSLGERIDVAIEELIATLKKKEEIEFQLKKNLVDKENKLEELDAALRQSIAITDEIEAKLKNEKELRKEADQRIAEIEKEIAVMQAASTTKCITCEPLLYKVFKTEGKLAQSNQEKTVQLQELHQIKRDVLKAVLSEKDAHLALLEHSGIQTPTQADQAAKLKADKKILLDRLREEDEKSIKLDFKRETTSHLFQKIFKISDDSDDSSDNNNNNNSNSFDDRFSRINLPKSIAVNDDSSPTSTITSCKYS